MCSSLQSSIERHCSANDGQTASLNCNSPMPNANHRPTRVAGSAATSGSVCRQLSTPRQNSHRNLPNACRKQHTHQRRFERFTPKTTRALDRLPSELRTRRTSFLPHGFDSLSNTRAQIFNCLNASPRESSVSSEKANALHRRGSIADISWECVRFGVRWNKSRSFPNRSPLRLDRFATNRWRFHKQVDTGVIIP
ncbi:unnamed protein product [Tuwongella immobilis]|uniref:Uncharacterized protein n=1 Tax=Tuwongella immobilis TaxID=692036 RepID=A0A6C2YIA4_9BACT|nr:unnamed protein product [Tuwongella immobilis]VTR97946.1 unnamed protein product [Tuwongella immobilis]